MYSRSLKSDIGNIYGIVNNLSRTSKNDRNLLTKSSIYDEELHNRIREILFKLLNYKPADIPLNPSSKIVRVTEEYTEEEVEFNVSAGVRAQGSLLVPVKGKAPFPAIVAMHDHSGFYFYGKEKIISQQNEDPVLSRFKETCYEGRSWASEIAKRGYIVISIDAFYFGSRKIDPLSISDEMIERCPFRLENLNPGSDSYMEAYNNICTFLESLVVKHIFVSGTTWPAILLNDDIRSVDYLCTREEVDKTRIGSCGLSIGGFRSAMLASFDSRISCATVAGWISTFESMLYDGLRNHTYMVYIPGLTRYMDFPDLVSLVAPRPLFVQQCARDDLFSMEGMVKACEILGGNYSKLSAESKYKHLFYDNGHQFNIMMQEDAFAWFDRWFK